MCGSAGYEGKFRHNSNNTWRQHKETTTFPIINVKKQLCNNLPCLLLRGPIVFIIHSHATSLVTLFKQPPQFCSDSTGCCRHSWEILMFPQHLNIWIHSHCGCVFIPKDVSHTVKVLTQISGPRQWKVQDPSGKTSKWDSTGCFSDKQLMTL